MPSFNHAIEIRDVALLPVGGIGQFDHPEAFFIPLDGTNWNGVTPTDSINGERYDLDQIVLRTVAPLGLVIAMRTPAGCHDAKVVLRVLDLTDGQIHTIDTGWKVALDTGTSRGPGFGGCG